MARSGLLTRRPARDGRPKREFELRYIKSFLLLRMGIGGLGIALPWFLLIAGGSPMESSLSDYYDTSLRDYFVGALCAIGVFLLAYKVSERSFDNTFSIIAGCAAIGVALLPSSEAGGWHFTAAAIFIVSLAVISYQFGQREWERTDRTDKRRKQFWRALHMACVGLIMVGALLSLAASALDWGPRTLLFWGETLAVEAFGASWFLKGAELATLRLPPLPEPSAA